MKVLTTIVVWVLLVSGAEAGGQGKWCWVNGQTNAQFCDYSTYGSCAEKNKGTGGTCVPAR